MSMVNQDAATDLDLVRAAQALLKCERRGKLPVTLREALGTGSDTIDPITRIKFAYGAYRDEIIFVLAFIFFALTGIVTVICYLNGWWTYTVAPLDGALLFLVVVLTTTAAHGRVLLRRWRAINNHPFAELPKLEKTCAAAVLKLSLSLNLPVEKLAEMGTPELREKINTTLNAASNCFTRHHHLPSLDAKNFRDMADLYGMWASRMQHFREIFDAARALGLTDDLGRYFLDRGEPTSE